MPTRFLLLVLGVLLATSSCLPHEASWRLGFGNQRVRAVVGNKNGDVLQDTLVVVYRQHHTLLSLDNNAGVAAGLVGSAGLGVGLGAGQGNPAQSDSIPVRRVSTEVLIPTAEGSVLIKMPPDVVGLEILFIAKGHLSRVFRLQRQFGIGEVFYQARLERAIDWKSHYYTYLVPRLQPLLTEAEYQLSAVGQKALGNWLLRGTQTLEEESAKAKKGTSDG